MKIIKYILLVFILSSSLTLSAQIKWGLGAETIYNFKPKSLGFGLRGEIPFRKLSVVPQISYFPAFSFSQVKDFYTEIGLHYAPFTFGKWSPYILGAGGYNKRTYLAKSSTPGEKFSTWSAEPGLGIKMSTCLRPFAEFRYNIRWKEPTLRLGFMYFFNCKEKQLCPAYRPTW